MTSLRPIEIQDYELIKGFAEDPELSQIFRNMPAAWAWTPEQFQSWYFLPNSMTFIIRDEDEPVGLVQFFSFDSGNKKCEFGLGIKKCKNRREICVDALLQAYDYMFNYTGMNRLYCKVLGGRDKLMQLMEGWEHKFEGILRQSCLIKGRYEDELLYSLTADDFAKLENNYQAGVKNGRTGKSRGDNNGRSIRATARAATGTGV